MKWGIVTRPSPPRAPFNELIAARLRAGLAVAGLRHPADPHLHRGEPARRLRPHRRSPRACPGAGSIGVHLLRNSLIPVVTFLGTDLGALMGGAIVTEGIFNIHGVGYQLYQGDPSPGRARPWSSAS